MDRAALERLSRDEVIDLVIRLTEMIAVVGEQQEQLAEVKRRVAELEASRSRLRFARCLLRQARW
jgi:hypothetical protein